MGFNTTIVVLNDTLHDISEDSNFGKDLQTAILERGCRKDSARGPHQVRIVETHHADDMVLVAVGGNSGKNLGYVGNYRAEPLEMARNLAECLGYRLVRKKKTI